MRWENKIKYIVFGALIVYMGLGLASMISRLMLLLLLLVFSCSFCKTLSCFHVKVVNGFYLLLLLNVIYYSVGEKLVYAHVGPPWDTTGFFANIILNLTSFFYSYKMSLENKISQKEIVILFLCMFIVTSLRFVVERETILLERGGRNATMNLSYAFVSFFPFFYLIRNRLLVIMLLVISFVLVMNGAKRGAILIFLMSTSYYFYNQYIYVNSRLNIKYLLFGTIFIAILLYIAIDIIHSNEYLYMRLEKTMDGYTNGRDQIFDDIWEAWLNSNSLFTLFLGFGFCSSVPIAGNHAHNDWLELLSTAGLLGIIVYLTFFAQLFKYTRKCFSTNDSHILYLIVFIWLMKSFFSMAYCDIANMPLTFMLGYIIGKNNYDIRIVTKK